VALIYGTLPDFSIARGTLSEPQAAALGHVDTIARGREAAALLSVTAICQRAGLALNAYNEVMELVRRHAFPNRVFFVSVTSGGRAISLF